MTEPLPPAHTVKITGSGPADIAHPDPDHEGCDFEAYLAADWAPPNHPSLLGEWRFYRTGEHWSGSRDPD